ncbi:MAG: hypothetical protein U0269_18160 [Polyangiales bacterium]
MGDASTREKSTGERAALPEKSQEIVPVGPAGDWRAHLRAAREGRVIANRKRRRRQRARYLAAEGAPIVAVALWLAGAFVLSQRAPRSIPLWFAGSALIAVVERVRALVAARRVAASEKTQQHALASEIDAASVVGELATFESTAVALASRGGSSLRRTGALAFALAARGDRARAQELLAHNDAAPGDQRDERYRALAQLVLAAMDDDAATVQRVAPIAEQLATTAPTAVQRLVHALASPSPAPYRTASTSSLEGDDFRAWPTQFVPAVAEKLGARPTREHRAWFRAPSVDAIEPLPSAAPLSVRLQSNEAFLFYAIAAVFVTAAFAPAMTHPAGRRAFGLLGLSSMGAVLAVALVFERLRLHAATLVATTAVRVPIARWTALLATHAPDARSRLFAMARLACRHLLAGDNASALALARRIAAESHGNDSEVELYQCTSLWVAGLTRDERSTEALLAAIEQHAPAAASRVARRFDARLALAVAHNDQARVERMVVDAWEAAPPCSVAAWVAQRVAPTQDGDLYGEAIEQWIANMGLLTVVIDRAPWLARASLGPQDAETARCIRCNNGVRDLHDPES